MGPNLKTFVLIVLVVALSYTLWIRDVIQKSSRISIPYHLLPYSLQFSSNGEENINLTYGGEANLTGNELFHHKAYYDLRDPDGPRIRLLVTARCAGLTGYIDISINGTKLGIQWKKSTNSVKCPNRESCQYWHFDIASKVYKGEIPEKVTIHHNQSSKEVRLFISPSNYTDTVSACIGPLYWFNDWIRMIIFVEYWRYLGVSKILFTPSVISEDVFRVIEFYKAQGIVETHGWPLLPFNEKVDPNYSVHYVSDNLDTQHCGFWSSSKYTYIGDIDELLYIRNRTKLFEFLEMWNLRKKDLGGLKFKHTGLSFRPLLIPRPFNYSDFIKLDSLRHPMAFHDNRFPKSIFLTKFIRICWVHYPWEHFSKKKTYNVPQNEALYFHARENFDKYSKAINESKMYFPDVKLFADDELDDQIDHIRATIYDIFDDQIPEYRTPPVYAAIYACKKKGSLRRKGCSEPGVSCFQSIHKLDDWIYTEPSEESNYIPI